MKLEVVTPFGAKLDESDVSEVIASGTLGELGIMPGHESLLTALVPGRLAYIKGGDQRIFAADAGYLQVSEDTVRVITETCLAPEEIDVERAEKALARADEALKKASADNTTPETRAALDAARARAVTRLSISEETH